MMYKYYNLVHSLEVSRRNFCGVGTRKVKLLLNKLAKAGDNKAKLFRTALELQDANITAKIYFGEWREHYYQRKEELIQELVDICKTIPEVKYGYKNEVGPCTKQIIYFDLPGCGQLSYHCNLTISQREDIPQYTGIWDGEEDTAMLKLQEAIMLHYGKDIEKKKKTPKTAEQVCLATA